MKNNFSDKLNDFAEWTKIAFTHFNNEFFADSLTNMRKSGEAACKIVILHKFSDKISESKIGQKNYKELIESLIKENLVPRKVINWLETLQIHGNEATHDVRIMQEQSYYGIIALRLLIYWLYIEYLKSTVPINLQKEISQIKEKTVNLLNSKKVEEERSKLINEKEELEKKLNLLKGKENQENEKITNLTNELNNSVTKIKELDTAQQKITELEKQLSRYKTEADELKSKQTIPELPKKKTYTKVIAISAFSLVIIIAGFFILKNIHTNFNNAKNGKTNAEITKQQVDSFNVIVFPLTILQDNPNIKINFEEALIKNIRQKAQDIKLPLRIIYKSLPNLSQLSKSDLSDFGLKEKAIVVLYGELYEPMNYNDSIQVNIKNILIRNGNPFYDELGIKSFSKLSDSSALKIINSVECDINFTIAENYLNNKKKSSEALALIYNSVPITKIQKSYYCSFLAECHVQQKNYNAAIIELEKFIKLDPNNAYPYSFLGNIYKQMGDFKKSIIYCYKALKIKPNDVNTLQIFSASLIGMDEKTKFKVRKILEEALKYDTANSTTLFYLAETENLIKDYSSAKKHYQNAIRIKPDYTEAKINLATMLAFQLNEPEQAVEYINKMVAKDSNDVKALILLANIYTNTKIKDRAKAEYLLKKCNSFSKDNDPFQTNFSLGLNLIEKKDYNSALTYFLKAYSINKRDYLLCSLIAQIYFEFKDFPNAEKFFLHSYELDSVNYVTNYNLGYFYLNSTGNYQNINKAVYYFEKELKTNPYDTTAIQWLGNIYSDRKNIPKMCEISNKLQALTPNSSYLHKYLGRLADLQSDEAKALIHYKKSADMHPNDEEVCYKIAYILMKRSPSKSWKEALKYAELAISLNPKSADNNYIYSKILIFSGETKKGIEYYNKAKEINPNILDDEIEELLKKRGL